MQMPRPLDLMRVTPGFPAAPGCPGGPGIPNAADRKRASNSFLRGSRRRRSASIAASAYPVLMSPGRPLSFLSARNTPMARRFEIWVPNIIREALVFHSGDCDYTTDLATEYAQYRQSGRYHRVALADWNSSAARRCRRGQVVAAGLSAAMALPFIQVGELKAVAAWYF